MSEPTNGGPAFPFYVPGSDTAPEAYYGMTLLDYFAGQVLIEVYDRWGGELDDAGTIAKESYQIAAAMLEARKAYL